MEMQVDELRHAGTSILLWGSEQGKRGKPRFAQDLVEKRAEFRLFGIEKRGSN
jgi:hypothetical protein